MGNANKPHHDALLAACSMLGLEPTKKETRDALDEARSMLGLEGTEGARNARRGPRRVLSQVPNEADLEGFLRDREGWRKVGLWLYDGQEGAGRLHVIPGVTYYGRVETERGKQRQHTHSTKGVQTAVDWVHWKAGDPK